MNEIILTVLDEQAGMRLDLFLMQALDAQDKGFSRTFIQELIAEGKVRRKDERLFRPHYKVKAQEAIQVLIEPKIKTTLLPEAMPLEVVYEDQDIALINKQAGLVVHPAPGNNEHTLVNALLYRFGQLSDINPQRPGIVHRLDKETSGLLVVAKNNPVHLKLAKQFSEHSINRVYIAIVKGKVEFDENILELPIIRHPVKRENMAVGFSEGAKFAKTYYRTLKRGSLYSLLELRPFTGRTHQLRVHLDFLGHPILGDSKYGKNNEFSRLALHAKGLGFIHPSSGKFIEFQTELPEEFTEFINHKIA